MNKKIFTTKIGIIPLVVEFEKFAKQSNSSVFVKYGNTSILATVNIKINDINDNKNNFSLLTVSFQEKYYSLNKIPQNFFKREGKLSENSILISRILDRAIRPIFPNDFYHEIEVIVTPFSIDEKHDFLTASFIAVSLALLKSNAPFNQPIAGIKYKINTKDEKIDITIAGTNKVINMIEMNGKNIQDERIFELLRIGHNEIKKIIKFQKKIISNFDIKEIFYKKLNIPIDIQEYVDSFKNEVFKIFKNDCNNNFDIEKLKNKVINNFSDDEEFIKENLFFLEKSYNNLLKMVFNELVLIYKKRLDNRKFNQIRILNCEIDKIPLVHGSGVFSRGQTQVISILTLDDYDSYQIIDDIFQEKKRFIHHYNFPAFSVGDINKFSKISRREIGHGSLVEKAISSIIPSGDIFPYTIRIVSEVLGSNGSSSQASICSSSLALMTAGIPIKEHIAGISMGIVKNKDKYEILTDIQELEDYFGLMDFKIAGTKNGICAMQLDVKDLEIDFKILKQTIKKSKIARIKILNKMNKIISKPRKNLPDNAIKFYQDYIPIENIKDIIGNNGKIIKQLIEKFDNPKIIIKKNGKIIIFHKNEKLIKKIWKYILEIITPIKLNSIYYGKIKKIENYGAFIKLNNNFSGLLHISEIPNPKNSKNINDLIKLEQLVKVKVINIKNNKLKLSLKLNDNDS